MGVPRPLPFIVKVLHDVGHGLLSARSNHVLHMDVKAANVVLDWGGPNCGALPHALVIDFGCGVECMDDTLTNVIPKDQVMMQKLAGALECRAPELTQELRDARFEVGGHVVWCGVVGFVVMLGGWWWCTRVCVWGGGGGG